MMEATDMSAHLALATSATEVRDLHQEVRLGMRNNLVYNMSI